MLKPKEFSDVQLGIGKISDFIQAKSGEDVNFEEDIKEKKRRKTWFLDTTRHSFNERNKFLLRVREEDGTGKYDTTLKCRHPDRYLSASYDLWSPKQKLQFKFEEDISTPFISKFSFSASFEDSEKPDLSNFKDVKNIFPNLIIKDILETESLSMVNNFEATEKSYEIGTLEFSEKKSVNLDLNLWYLKENINKTIPLIVELTFNYESKKQPEKNQTLLEEFSPTVVKKTNSFYHLLQDEEIADLLTTKTKTEFAYSYKKSR